MTLTKNKIIIRIYTKQMYIYQAAKPIQEQTHYRY